MEGQQGAKDSPEHNEIAPAMTSFQKEENSPRVTPKTWVVVFFLSMGFGLSFWPVPVMGNIGSSLSSELQNPSASAWFVPSWTIAVTTTYMIVGANTDLIGRRWFIVGGNLLCFVGLIVLGAAKNTNAVIAGMVVTGLGSGTAQMANFALSELLPNKWRHIGVVLADAISVLASIIAPFTGRYGIKSHTWRWNFYAVAILQGLTFLGLFAFYKPLAHPLGIPFRTAVREIDYLGMFLFTAGAVPALMGIIWTTSYASDDAHVIATLTVGFVILAFFALWETFSGTKHPLTPPEIFASSFGRDFTAPLVTVVFSNMFYYSGALIWPTMVTVFYGKEGEWALSAVLSAVQGIAVGTGSILLAVLGGHIKHWRWQLTGSVFVMVLFGALWALGTPHNQGFMVACTFLSQTGFAWAIYLSVTVCQLGVAHRQLGVAGSLSGVARYSGGSSMLEHLLCCTAC